LTFTFARMYVPTYTRPRSDAGRSFQTKSVPFSYVMRQRGSVMSFKSWAPRTETWPAGGRLLGGPSKKHSKRRATIEMMCGELHNLVVRGRRRVLVHSSSLPEFALRLLLSCDKTSTTLGKQYLAYILVLPSNNSHTQDGRQKQGTKSESEAAPVVWSIYACPRTRAVSAGIGIDLFHVHLIHHEWGF
jgi:hypothetical protein